MCVLAFAREESRVRKRFPRFRILAARRHHRPVLVQPTGSFNKQRFLEWQGLLLRPGFIRLSAASIAFTCTIPSSAAGCGLGRNTMGCSSARVKEFLHIMSHDVFTTSSSRCLLALPVRPQSHQHHKRNTRRKRSRY